MLRGGRGHRSGSHQSPSKSSSWRASSGAASLQTHTLQPPFPKGSCHACTSRKPSLMLQAELILPSADFPRLLSLENKSTHRLASPTRLYTGSLMCLAPCLVHSRSPINVDRTEGREGGRGQKAGILRPLSSPQGQTSSPKRE